MGKSNAAIKSKAHAIDQEGLNHSEAIVQNNIRAFGDHIPSRNRDPCLKAIAVQDETVQFNRGDIGYGYLIGFEADGHAIGIGNVCDGVIVEVDGGHGIGPKTTPSNQFALEAIDAYSGEVLDHQFAGRRDGVTEVFAINNGVAAPEQVIGFDNDLTSTTDTS